MSPEAAQTLFAQALQWNQEGRLIEAKAVLLPSVIRQECAIELDGYLVVMRKAVPA